MQTPWLGKRNIMVAVKYIYMRVRGYTHIKSPNVFVPEVTDVVHSVLYLLSDKADMINGVTLNIDGGASAV